jgi:hypothetical protein
MSTADLLQEMNALAVRYGVERCEDALTVVKGSWSPKKKCSTSWVLDMSSLGIEHTLGLLMGWVLGKPCTDRLSLTVGRENEDTNNGWVMLMEMERYHDRLRLLQPTDSPSESQKVESKFHTLQFNHVQEDKIANVLDRKKCVALFEKVAMDGVSLNVTRINQLIRDEGVISSLRVWDCNLRSNQVRKFVEILEVNRLESLEMKLKVRNTQRFAQALILSLNRHIKTFAERSIFKELEVSDTLHGIDSHVQQDLFNVIADLPNLWYFGIDISDVDAFVTLSASIGNWKIRHFKLLCEMGNDVIDFGPLFEAISRSNHLKVFSFGPLITGQVLSARTSTQLLDLAVLPTSGLHEINLDAAILSTLDREDVDPSITARSQLRHFNIVSEERLVSMEDEIDDQGVAKYLRGVLTLLSNHLPYLYSVGLTMDNWEISKRFFRYRDNVSECLELWTKIWIQTEKNQVGMALLQPEVCSTVPGGLWSIVVHRAISWDDDPAKLPWTGIYSLVRGLVEGGHCGWTKEAPPSSVLLPEESSRRKRPRIKG